MFSMLPIPNFVLPIPHTSIVVPSTIQATSRSWSKISNRGTISTRIFVYECSCGSSVQSRVVCMIRLCISKKAELQPGWLSTSLFCVQGSTPHPSHIPASPWALKCCQLNSENHNKLARSQSKCFDVCSSPRHFDHQWSTFEKHTYPIESND